MAAKRIHRIAKIQLVGGQAKPGPALASIGINMVDFTKQFNEKTKERNGEVVPTVITAYSDKSFQFELKTTPVTYLLKKAAKVEKGSANSKTRVGTVSYEQIRAMAEYKLQDTTAWNLEGVIKMITGSAKQMGIHVEGFEDKEKGGN